MLRVRHDNTGLAYINSRDLQALWLGGELPLSEQLRRYFGRALTPEIIEQVIRAAELGYMRDLTDLTYETIAIDPHLGSVIGKRLRALAAVQPKVVPASGDGIDPRLAQRYADVVRQQLAWIPNFKQHLTRLNWGHCHGRAALEKVWRENPGGEVRWRIDQLHWIHPRRLSFGPERELRVRDDYFAGAGFEARGLEMRAYPCKFITFTPQLFNDYPEREGFGPRCLYFSFFKRFSKREQLVLLEVFGKPWRIVYAEHEHVQQDTLDQAGEAADAMGANATGVMPPGVRAELVSPGQSAGQVHRDVIVDADDQISKLVLGTTRTTDAKPNALGSAGDEVGQEEQSSVFAADGWNLSDCLTEQFAADIILLNFGPERLDHCPRIEIQYEIPPSRGTQIEHTAKVFAMGQPIKRDEFYERVGFTPPSPGDEVVQPQQAPAFGLPGMPPLPQPSRPGPDEGSASPLGEGGTGDIDRNTMSTYPLAVARAMRVLELVQHLTRKPTD